jgi:hypothetical protein
MSMPKQELVKHNHKALVLLTIQWTPTLDIIQIPDNIVRAIALTREQEIQWCIKFHPVEIREINKSYLVSYAIDVLGETSWDNIIDLSSNALPAILPFVSYHVTGFSSATCEASFFGVKTGLGDNRDEVAAWFHKDLSSNHAESLPKDSLEISRKITYEASRNSSSTNP